MIDMDERFDEALHEYADGDRLRAARRGGPDPYPAIRARVLRRRRRRRAAMLGGTVGVVGLAMCGAVLGPPIATRLLAPSLERAAGTEPASRPTYPATAPRRHHVPPTAGATPESAMPDRPVLFGPHAGRWEHTLETVFAARGRAWKTLDAAALGSVYVARSEPLRRDVELMHQYRTHGFTGAIDLAVKLTRVQVVAESPHRVEVRVTQVLQPYQVKGRDGRLIPSPDGAIGKAAHVTVELTKVGGRWLIERWD